MSIPLFPSRELKPEPDALETWIICAMVQDFIKQWDAIYPAILTCEHPDQHGSLYLWDDHFAGVPK